MAIAGQIADALEAAHDAGIIHRDLKPANVKVRQDGAVKVLDFGLAKAVEPSPGDASASASPTISLTAAATQLGMVIGTAAYMSPEQARGKPVDRRADIWAFGVVLYEMLTGARPFQGEDVSLTLASVMKSGVDLQTLPPDLPAPIRNVIDRCLEKDPARRIRDIGDVRLAMEGAFETTTALGVVDGTGTARPLAVWQRPVPLALGAAVLAAAGAVAALTMRPEAVPAPIARFGLSSPGAPPVTTTINFADVAMTPDGSRVVYMGGPVQQDSALRVRSLDSAEVATLEATTGPTSANPFVSPDGQWVGFMNVTEGTLDRVSILGGPAEPIVSITEATGAGLAWGATWAADDTIIFGTSTESGLWRIPTDGGEAEEITRADGVNHAWPELLPGERGVLFTILTADLDEAQIAVADLDTGAVRVLTPGSAPKYSATGHLVYAAAGSLRAVGFDLEGLEVTTGPVPVVDGIGTKTSGAVSYDLSDSGTLVYVAGEPVGAGIQTVAWYGRDGLPEYVPGLDPAAYQSIAISPDGTRLALEIVGANEPTSKIWSFDLARQTLGAVTDLEGGQTNPLWTPDGAGIVFTAGRSAGADLPSLVQTNADGTGTPQQLFAGDGQVGLGGLAPVHWAPDGQLVAMLRQGSRNSLFLLPPTADAAPVPLLESDADERRAALSPTGGWLAYDSNRSGRYEIYVERFPDMTDRQLVSVDGGRQPRWSPDGRELYYLDGSASRLLAVRVTIDDSVFRAGTAEVVVDRPFFITLARSAYDITPDGERFAAIITSAVSDPNAEETPEIQVVLNWASELETLVPLP